MEERIIHTEWEGPYSLNQLDTLKDLRKDRGLYQIYGHHPVYGSNVLLMSARRSGGRSGRGSRNTTSAGVRKRTARTSKSTWVVLRALRRRHHQTTGATKSTGQRNF